MRILSSPTCVDLKYNLNYSCKRKAEGDLTIEQKVKAVKMVAKCWIGTTEQPCLNQSPTRSHLRLRLKTLKTTHVLIFRMLFNKPRYRQETEYYTAGKI